MSDEELLAERLDRAAAGPPPTFDHTVIRHRARRRRARNRTAVAVVVALVIVGTASLAARPGKRALVTASRVTLDQLIGDRWVPTAYSGVVVPPEGAFLDFGRGSITGTDGCSFFDGRWSLTDDVLQVDPLRVTSAHCETVGDLLAIIEADPVLSQPDGERGPIELREDDRWVQLTRFDRFGVAVTEADLGTTWVQPGATYRFDPSGELVVTINGCSTTGRWRLDGATLQVDDLDRTIDCSVDGGDGIVAGGAIDALRSDPQVRLASGLWLSGDLGVLRLAEAEQE